VTSTPTCSFLTGGDIAPEQIAPTGMFGALAELFRGTDFSFLNVEHPLSQKGTPVRGKRFLHRGRNEHVQGLVEAGVSAINLANNHILDFGDDALLDTIDQLEKNRIPYFGAGANIDVASAPLIAEKNGIKIGLLGYTSTLPTGFAAGPRMAGVNPLRVRTAYRPAYNLDELPGTAPIIETWPASEDLARLTSQVSALKQIVDVVLVYVHWGVSMVPQVHEHQRAIGQAAIDAGAGAVFGGHQHVVSAVEFHRGNPIVHCTGDLVFDVVEPWFDDSTERNFLFGATLTKNGLVDCYALGCQTGIGQAPTLQPPGTAIGDKIAADLKLFSEPYGAAVDVSGDRILLSPSAAQPFVPRFGAALHTMGYPSSALHEAAPVAQASIKSSGEQYLK
jgi:poly-gamma-glutamate capsule biosynthesis protein CapA/YwtB (metallophosphatase superfamily)